MNRRDFMKFAGVSWFSLFLPKGLQMATYTELMMKMADGQQLDAIEREQLRQYAGEMESNNKLVSSWQNINGNIDAKYLNLPVNLIYSTTLVEDTASISIDIPSIYKHLLIFSYGRSTAAGTGVTSLRARFNSDTASNYESQLLYGISSSAGSVTSAVIDWAIIGGLPKSGEAAGYSGSGFAFLPGYGGAFYKTMLMIILPGVAGYVFARSSTWKSTDPIRNIVFSPEAGNLQSGFSLSIYGFK